MFSLKTTTRVSGLVVSVANLAAASPLSHLPRDDLPESTITKQAKYCSDMNYSGTCQTDTWEKTGSASKRPDLSDKVSSFQALDPHLRYTLFRDPNCKVPSKDVGQGSGGVSNLNSKGWKFSDRMSRYHCVSVFTNADFPIRGPTIGPQVAN